MLFLDVEIWLSYEGTDIIGIGVSLFYQRCLQNADWLIIFCIDC